MTAEQRNDLDRIRWKLERMCRRRAEQPFTVWEADLYEQLTQAEAELLAAT